MSGSEAARRIVVGVDGSEQSKNALRWAKKLADVLGVGIDAISAFEVISDYGWSALPPYDSEMAQKTLRTTVDDVFGDTPPADLELHVRTGSPSYVLVDASRDALMVVVGSRGHGGFAGLLIGSVSSTVAEHAACPVLVVHGDRVVS